MMMASRSRWNAVGAAGGQPGSNSSATAAAALEIRDLAVRYGDRTVLDEISLTVPAGAFVCIVGPSGAGKTTLVRAISGLLPRATGSITIAGREVTGPPRDLALVSQDYSRSLMPWLRIADNVALPLRGKGIGKTEINSRVQQAMRDVGLVGVDRLYPWQLSGGMQQRVSIARALAYKPQVLVMDEPFASVDAQTRADLEDLVLALHGEYAVTVVHITHDIDESVYLGDRVVVIGGRPATVFRDIPVELDRPRDQLGTKSSPEFIACRSEVLTGVRSVQPLTRGGSI